MTYAMMYQLAPSVYVLAGLGLFCWIMAAITKIRGRQ